MMDGPLLRRFYRTPEGFGVPLPFQASAEESTLPGNVFVLEDAQGVLALATYDEHTRTGSVFCYMEDWEVGPDNRAGAWTMWQPVTRDKFFGPAGPVQAVVASFGFGVEALKPAWEGGKLEADSRPVG
jgi:hypothetical protein